MGHEDLNDNWVGAGHLKVGDKIRKADGTFGVVKYVNTVSETRTMYNLDVAVADTFFVGTQGWLVHNANGCPDFKALVQDLEQNFGSGGVHALRRHGEGVTLDQLKYRARTGLAPDGAYGAGRNGTLVDATRFNSNEDLYNAMWIAIQRQKAGLVKNNETIIDFGSTIGSGFRAGGKGGPVSSTQAIVKFDKNGKIYTAYPLIK